ncbi:MAG: FkbM family methyltransferase [Nitrospirae bacterium]|nr:FkbM family methyltransferase [Nitrospirota bacterium]
MTTTSPAKTKPVSNRRHAKTSKAFNIAFSSSMNILAFIMPGIGPLHESNLSLHAPFVNEMSGPVLFARILRRGDQITVTVWFTISSAICKLRTTMSISLGTRDKLLTLVAGLRYARLADKPAFLVTSIRHMAAYGLGLGPSPREMTVTLKGHVFRFREFTGEIGMFPQVFLDLVYERLPGFGHLNNPRGTVLDVGANVGMYTIRIGSLNPEARVYALEPNPEVYRRLTENIRLNRLTNARAFNYGVSDTETSGYMDAPASTVLGTVRAERVEGAAEVRLTTLDSFIEAECIDHIDILKLDVEGYELKALNGIKRNLSRIDRIVMECDAEHYEPVGRLLKKAGFGNPLNLPKFSIRYFTRP